MSGMEREGEPADQSTTHTTPTLIDGIFVSREHVPVAVWWDGAAGRDGALRLVDQTRLPGEYAVLCCEDLPEVAAAIRTLRVRGAPAIGVAAAFGLALGARAVRGTSMRSATPSPADMMTQVERMAAELRATRPTAVNLAWALERLLRAARIHLAEGGADCAVADRLLEEAQAIADEDAAACRAMGQLGADLIADGDTLLTHCNAGALATAGIGTALAPIFIAHAAGKRLHVYVDETRPVLQGARLTAWELTRAGVPMTLITDSMAAHFMRHGGIRAVLVGADRIAANGDVANKIGTYGLAILAREHGIPLYVVAPRSTIDLTVPGGDAIPIEQRAAEEVTTVRGVAIAPTGARAANPAFDVTPANYVTAIVTEAGIARAPYTRSLAALFAEGIASERTDR
jgi:methylthioribose-1-phosphate isomerase